MSLLIIARNANILLITECTLLILCSRNKKSSTKLNKKGDFAVSSNLAYGKVKLKSTMKKGGLYEEPDRVVQSDEGHYEFTEYPGTTDGPPEAPVYDTVDVQRE